MTIQIVPESAPFTPQQRAWLNGFLAGVIGSLEHQPFHSGASTSSDAAATMLVPTVDQTSVTPSTTDPEDYPWHDASLSIEQRMELAQDQPPPLRMMAAMAQLNCGSCGYLCHSYAQAISQGTETNLTLCTPGGSETAKMIRKLKKETNASADQTAPSMASEKPISLSGMSLPGTRDNPITAKVVSQARLNREGSAKETRHVIIDLNDSGLQYKVGDALGVYPLNCPDFVANVLKATRIDGTEIVEVDGQSLRIDAALASKCLRTIPQALVYQSLACIEQRMRDGDSTQRNLARIDELRAFEDSESMDQWDVQEFFEYFDEVNISAQELTNALSSMRPRLYSIASSQRKFPQEVHLTVGKVTADLRGRIRKGVASTMLSDRVAAGSKLRVFVHPSHGFTVPSDPTAPMIMVGPGTGIAPFIAFLQEREMTEATGKNWLFFGDQTRSYDFLYEQQLLEWTKSGLLARLDLAFSRDSDKKLYVQHLMTRQGKDLFQWLEAGGFFFVCGDASRMAVDVEQALLGVIVNHGKRSIEEAKQYLMRMSKEKRYVKDVY